MALIEEAQKINKGLYKANRAKMGKFFGGAIMTIGVVTVVSPYSPGKYMAPEFAHAAQDAGAFGLVVGALIMTSSLALATARENIAKLRFKKLVKTYGTAEEKAEAATIAAHSDLAARNAWTTVSLAGTTAATAATIMYPSVLAAVGVGVLAAASTLIGSAANEQQVERNSEARQSLQEAIVNRRRQENSSTPAPTARI